MKSKTQMRAGSSQPGRSKNAQREHSKKNPRGRFDAAVPANSPPMGLDNVLFRPDRMQYVRGQSEKKIAARGQAQGAEHSSKLCVFCQALSIDPTLVLASTPCAFAVLNKYPYNNGHLLVLPRRHVGDLVALTREETEHTQALIRFAIEVQRETSSVQGFNVGLNLGAAAGAGLPDHLHWHLVPRWSGDLNFFPLIARSKVVVETLEMSKQRIGPRLQAKVNEWLQSQIVAE